MCAAADQCLCCELNFSSQKEHIRLWRETHSNRTESVKRSGCERDGEYSFKIHVLMVYLFDRKTCIIRRTLFGVDAFPSLQRSILCAHSIETANLPYTLLGFSVSFTDFKKKNHYRFIYLCVSIIE